jgi:hypothetical protein
MCRKCRSVRRKGPRVPGPLVHHRFTTEWATEEGLTQSDAEVVAEADITVDLLWPGSRKWGRHFAPWSTLLFAPRYYRQAVRVALEGGSMSESLVALGRCLHCRQDGVGHGMLGLGHLLPRLGLSTRDPDEWKTMPPRIKAGIERVTRETVRRYVVDSGYAAKPPRA